MTAPALTRRPLNELRFTTHDGVELFYLSLIHI